MSWYLHVLTNFLDFSGRARRKEYWYFTLVNIIVVLLLMFAASMGGAGIHTTSMLVNLYFLVILIPSVAVGIRRLHDTGRSGWWLLISLIPLIGALVLLFFNVQDSQPGENLYGPNPKAAD